MGRKYEAEHPEDPYDLTDVRGIASELIEEAADDTKAVAGNAAKTVADTATDLAEGAVDEANAAYRYPRAYAGYTLRRLERRARERPLGTLTAVAAVSFFIGALWGVRRRYP